MTASPTGRPGSEAESFHPIGSETIRWRLFLLAAIGPLTAVSVGVDGGDIFQLLAVDTLALDPRAVGAALLLGALSIPIQVWAARISLVRARHNIRFFLWSIGAMAMASALVVFIAPAGSWIAGLVLVIAVLAEISVSVLFATSWQPLISYTLTVDQRQFINGRGQALAGLVMLAAAVSFGQLGQVGRASFLAGLGVVAVMVGWSLRILPPPPTSPEVDPEPSDPADSDANGGSLTNVFIALPASAFASWPLLVSYAAVVMWPTGDLGLLAGALVLGSITASALWRDPGRRLIPLIRLSAVVVAACSVVLALIESPVQSDRTVIVLLVAIVIGAAARTIMRTAIMELAHRRIDPTNAVRVMTLIDVVGSTSFQVGAFIAGFLIAASIGSGDALDLYRIWLLITTVALLVAASRFRATVRG